jgi:acetyltransferase-like isoleucine patch superfamily enzyme
MKFDSRSVRISPTATIGHNVRIGDNTVIGDGVHIGDNTVIANDCWIGEPLSDYYFFEKNYQNPPTHIGANCLVRSHAIVYAGTHMGDHTSTGHRVTIREYTRIGAHCRIGTNCDLQGHLDIGDYCWLHSEVFVAQGTRLGHFVLIYPKVMFANDKMPPSNETTGAVVADFGQVAACSVVMPGIRIGQHALVGSSSVVTRDVPDYAVAVGNPARLTRDVRDLLDPDTQMPLYPWPMRFSRGMPWAEVGFEAWQKARTH